MIIIITIITVIAIPTIGIVVVKIYNIITVLLEDVCRSVRGYGFPVLLVLSQSPAVSSSGLWVRGGGGGGGGGAGLCHPDRNPKVSE